MTNPDQNQLGEMLTYMRPNNSEAERTFNKVFLDSIEGMNNDKIGNRWLQVGTGCPIIWSSHTDTVHRSSGRQKVCIKSSIKDKAFAYSNSNCLGADCTTGVFIMLHMISNNVPGLYIFHASEEVGCVGSKALVAANKETFSKNYKAAIAFDRKGTGDIITHQLGGRTCSDKFADSFAKQLGKGYSGNSNGVYTDTAHYAEFVSECTNISVGYYNQHSNSEWQDIEHALWLADRMTKIDLNALVFDREPRKEQPYYYNSGGYGYRSRRASYGPATIWDLANEYPYSISKFLEDEGYTIEDIKEWCKKNARHVHDRFDW